MEEKYNNAIQFYNGLKEGKIIDIEKKKYYLKMPIAYDGIQVVVETDSSTAIGIASKRGLGRVRHIEVADLWLQEKITDKVIKLNKVKRRVEKLSDKGNLFKSFCWSVNREFSKDKSIRRISSIKAEFKKVIRLSPWYKNFE